MKRNWLSPALLATILVCMMVASSIGRPRPVDPRLEVLRGSELNASSENPSLEYDSTAPGNLPVAAANPYVINSRGALVAQTWRDRQAISTIGRTIGINPTSAPQAGVHMCWTEATTASGTPHWKYGSFDPLANSFPMPGGWSVNPNGAGVPSYFPRIAVQRNGAAAIGGYDALSNDWVMWDNLFSTGTFPGKCGVTATQPPFGWPTMDWAVMGPDTIMYLATFENTGTLGREARMRVYRSVKSAGGCQAWQIVFTDYSSYPSQDISCDRTSGRVAVAWTRQIPLGNGRMDNDVWYATSPAGLSGTWTKTNITNFPYRGCGYRPWMELSTLFDTFGRFHVVWNAALKYPIAGSLYGYSRRCRLFHWSENNMAGIYTVYSSESNTQSQCYGGSNVMNVGHFSVGECGQGLVVIFTAFNDPKLSAFTDDCCSNAPYWRAANGDTYVTYSSSLSGNMWDKPRNLSNSYSPGCDSTSGCADDRWGSISRFGMSDASYAGTETWTNAYTYDPSGSYTGSQFIHVYYETDRYPGSFSASPAEGPATLNDMRWIRLACVNPRIIAGVILPPDTSAFIWTKPGVQKNVRLMLENIGTADAVLVGVVVHEDSAKPSTPMGWLSVAYGLSPIPAGGSAPIDVYLNSSGVITSQPVVAWGHFSYIYSSAGGTDTLEIPLSITVADSVVAKTDTLTISTPRFRIAVSSNANMGNCWQGGVNMDYSSYGDCDTGYNSRGDAMIYLGDASPVIVRKEGAGIEQAPGDAIGTWSMYLGGKGKAGVPLPPGPVPIIHAKAFAPLPVGPGPSLAIDVGFAEYSTGVLCTSDSLVRIEKTWWAPQHSDSSNFIVQRMRVYPNTIGTPVSGLQIGEAFDFDIPSDSAEVNNVSGVYTPLRLVYMRGYNSADTVTDCANNATRYGGVALLMMYQKNHVLDSAFRNIMSIPNDQYVYPDQNFDPDSLWMIGSIPGYYTDSRITDQTALLTYKGGPTGYTLAANDTLTIWTAVATVKTAASQAAGLDSLKAAITKARQWYLPLRNADTTGTSCCIGTTGNVNMNGIVDLADLSALVSYLTGGGFVLPCVPEANVNSSGIVDLTDLSALVSYLTGGGYVLPNCP